MVGEWWCYRKLLRRATGAAVKRCLHLSYRLSSSKLQSSHRKVAHHRSAVDVDLADVGRRGISRISGYNKYIMRFGICRKAVKGNLNQCVLFASSNCSRPGHRRDMIPVSASRQFDDPDSRWRSSSLGRSQRIPEDRALLVTCKLKLPRFGTICINGVSDAKSAQSRAGIRIGKARGADPSPVIAGTVDPNDKDFIDD